MITVTAAQLRRLCPKAKEEIIGPLAAAMESVLPVFAITTPARVAHFLAQAAHETAGFTTLQELGGGAYFEKMYGPATARGKRLGNRQSGDGARYHGRGIFQLTGRTNYRLYGAEIGLDLEANPELAAHPEVSLRIACEYWRAHNLNRLADAGDVVAITKAINGGKNGLAERQALTRKALAIWAVPDAVPLPNQRPAAPAPEMAPPAPEPQPVAPVSPPPAAIPSPPPAVPAAPATDLATAPPIAMDGGRPWTKLKTLWNSAASTVSGGGAGAMLHAWLQDERAQWALFGFAGLTLVATVTLAIVFRERIAKWIEDPT